LTTRSSVLANFPPSQMSPNNLAVVFAPTIMRDKTLEREMTDYQAKTMAVQFMIEKCDEIFGPA
jgi:Rho-type GTPase-activating protein 1/2